MNGASKLNIALPILLSEGDDVIVFESVESAQRFIEPVDIDAYTAYDAAGRLLRITSEGNDVRIEPAETEPSHAHNLRKSLERTLSSVGESGGDADLATLIERARKAFAYR
jgi:hypothetical protein